MNLLVVEFVGIPGSGKTTVAREVIRLLKSQGIRCPELEEVKAVEENMAGRSIPGQLWVLRKVLFNFPLIWRTLRFVRAYYPRDWNNFLIRSRAVLIGHLVFTEQLKAFSATKYQLILFDEAMLQKIFPVVSYGSELSEDRAQRFIKKTVHVKNHLVVLHHPTLRAALDRIESRSTMYSTFDRMERNEAKPVLKRAREKLPQLIGNSSLNFLMVDGEEAVRSKAEKIAERIIEEINTVKHTTK
jgi:thymidylate kinase